MRKITKFCEITAQKKGKADGKKEIVFLAGCAANVTKLWETSILATSIHCDFF